MNRYVVLTALLVALLVVFTGYLFVVQNSTRTTQLSLNVGFAAWQLTEPVQVPALIGVAFGAGFLLALMWLLPGRMRLAARVRRLEQEAAIGTADRGAEWR